MPTHPSEALGAWFLGPRAENAELLERLVIEALRDHVFWRRNYHPEDGFAIREMDKRREGYEETVATLTQELMGLLAELKRDVPFFSGRYKGHMIGEQTIAAQVGYFATMLYNPNNIAIESSPVTTRLELEVAGQLSRMIGYDPTRSWGHLTSGGTIANFEALWLARSVRYLAVAIAGAANELGLELPVRLPGGGQSSIVELPLWALLNVANRDSLDLWERLWASAPRPDVERAFANHSLAAIGYQEYSRRLALDYGDPLPAGIVLVAATAHYSWEKIVRALGIGSNQLVHIPVDRWCRMDPDALWERVNALVRRRHPILALVSVCGTTEESAVDRLDQLLQVRARVERELGATFHVHSDACYGGYAAAVTRRADGTRRLAAEIRASMGADWPSDEWVSAVEALGEADSVTVDPHKMGYVPYSAGAVLVRDGRARHLVATDPPYLSPVETSAPGTERFLGRYILEGSKPGAAAAAVWLSHKVLPLDERGYGYLVGRTVAGARRFHAALAVADLSPFRVILLPAPDINIVCYLLCHPSLRSLREVNDFNERVYARMSLARSDGQPEYIITRTRLRSPAYDGAIEPILDALAIRSVDEWKASGMDGLVVLRSTIMDPFLAAPPPAPDHASGFLGAVRRACDEALGERPLHGPFTTDSAAPPHVGSVPHREETMTVAELMERKVKTVRSEATVAEAIMELADAHISGMPVVDGAGRVIGVLSTTDLLTAEAETGDVAARRSLWENTAVRELMTPRPFTIAPDEDAREAARQMLYADVHRLFVAEGDQVIGVISTTDIVRAVATGRL